MAKNKRQIPKDGLGPALWIRFRVETEEWLRKRAKVEERTIAAVARRIVEDAAREHEEKEGVA